MTTLLPRLAAPAAVAAAVALLVPVAAARAADESVIAGPVTATLSWSGEASATTGAALRITRDGALGFNQAIPDVVCDGCVLAGGGSDDVQVADLDGDGENEVIVTASTGGAECCVELGVWDFLPSGSYRETDADLGTVGFNLDDLDGDGVPEFNSFDARFNALFTDHADELPPPLLEHYLHQDGVPVFADVTTGFPALVRHNAAGAKRRFARLHGRDPNAGGWVATYVADQYLLGRGATGLHELDRQAARGILGSPKAARSYRSRLLKLLRRYGYR